MSYIFINPVVERMYPRQSLNRFLARHGFERVECGTDWAAAVLKKYRALLGSREETVADARCPEAAEFARREGRPGVYVAPIEPILLHCAREISQKRELAGRPKVITTPCRALAREGNRLGLRETEFVAWNQLLKELGDGPEAAGLDESPIPPGYFSPLGVRAATATGPGEVLSHIREREAGRERIWELLYCRGGCHNGDGVMGL